MTLETLRPMLNRRPFEPLRIKTSGGQVIEVRHPKMVLPAKSALIVMHPDTTGQPTDRVEFISYLHISSVETLAGKAA